MLPPQGQWMTAADTAERAPRLVLNAKAACGLIRGEDGGGDDGADVDMQVLLVERAALGDRLAASS